MMACDVRILYMLLALDSTLSVKLGLQFNVDPVSLNIASPNTTVKLSCATNLPPDNIRWYLNHSLLPLCHLKTKNFSIHTSRNNLKPRDNYLHNENRNMGKKLAVCDLSDNGSNNNIGSLMFDVVSYSNGTSYLNIHVMKNSELYSLQVGIYQCVATLGTVSLASAAGRLDVAVLGPFPDSNYKSVVVVADGGSAYISCPRPLSVPPAVLTYTRDLLPLSHDTASVTPSGELLLTPATAGTYRCAATNTVLDRTLHSKQTITVMHQKRPPLRLVSPVPGLTIVREGDSVRLHCLTNWRPADAGTWWTVQEHHPAADPSLLSRSHVTTTAGTAAPALDTLLTFNGLVPLERNGSVVFFGNISGAASGRYTCHAKATENETAQALTAQVDLYVQVAPYVIQGLRSTSLQEGQEVRVLCLLGGRPAPQLHWLSNGRLLRPGTRVTIGTDGSLTLHNITRRDAGVLQCCAHNALGSVSSYAYYTVTPNTVTTAAGSGGRRRDGGSRGRGSAHGSLEVEAATPSRPQCRQLSDDTFHVNWSLPRAADTPLFSKVQYRELPLRQEGEAAKEGALLSFPHLSVWRTEDNIVPPPHTSALVGGLLTGRMYKFRVWVVYPGAGERVSPSSGRCSLTPRAPLQPPGARPRLTSVAWLPSLPCTVEAAWRYRSESGGTDGFIVSYRPAHTTLPYTKLRYLSGARRRVVVAGVRGGPLLQFRVQAFNMAGVSAASPPWVLADDVSGIASPPPRIPHSLESTDGSKWRNGLRLSPQSAGDDQNEEVHSSRHPQYGTFKHNNGDDGYAVVNKDKSDSEGRAATSEVSVVQLLLVLSLVLLVLLFVLASYAVFTRCRTKDYNTPPEQFQCAELPGQHAESEPVCCAELPEQRASFEQDTPHRGILLRSSLALPD